MPTRRFFSWPTITTVVILFATIVVCYDCKPEIITYGDCPCRKCLRHPYEIQRPPTVHRPKPAELPVIRGTHCYGIEKPSEPLSELVGFELPVGIQRPLVAPTEQTRILEDPLRGKTYGFKIQRPVTTPEPRSCLGEYGITVHNTIPKPTPKPQPKRQCFGTFGMTIDRPVEPTESSLWGDLPIAIQRPSQPLTESVPVARRPPLLRGLTTTIDRIVMPIDCEPEKNDPCDVETPEMQFSTENDSYYR